MSVDTSKRAFLFRKKPEQTNTDIGLPWLIDHAQFLDKCTQCGHCTEQCDENIITRGQGGYPTVDFSLGECTFCQDCTKGCPESLFDSNQAEPWQIDVEITAECFPNKGIVCQSCSDVCEPRAIRFKYIDSPIAKPVVNNDLCTGCGACVSTCPTDAIVLGRVQRVINANTEGLVEV